MKLRPLTDLRIAFIFSGLALLVLFPATISSQILQKVGSDIDYTSITDTIPNPIQKDRAIHIQGRANDSKNVVKTSSSAEIIVKDPNSNSSWKVGSEETVEWSTAGVSGDVYVSLYRGEWQFVRTMYRVSGASKVAWTVPPYIEPGDDYFVVIQSVHDSDIWDRSDGTFAIEEGTGPYITMLSPESGEKWTVGEEEEIRWTSRNISDEVEIRLYRRGAILVGYISLGTPDDGTFNFTLNENIEPRTDYYVGVISKENKSVWDTSNYFQIGFSNTDLSGLIDTRGEAWDIEVLGNYAYIADEDGGITIADISNPSKPIEVSTFETIGRALTVEVRDDIVFVADESGGVQIIDVSDQANPKNAGEYITSGDAWGISVVNDFAYVAIESEGLQILNISDLSNITEVSRFDTPGSAVNVSVRGDIAYVSDFSSGLLVLDISNPYSPSEVSYIETQGEIWDVEIIGNLAYVADSGLRILDISDPSNPIEVSHFKVNNTAWDVTVSGNYAYLAADNEGIRTIDISSSKSPIETGYFKTPNPAYGVSSSGEYIYVAARESGVYIIKNQSDDDIISPLPPTGLNASLGNGEIKISWNPNMETDLSEYRLYKFAFPQQNVEQVATIIAGDEEYTDMNVVSGRIYSYWISAVDAVGNESEFSDEIQISLNTPSKNNKVNFIVHSPDYEFDSLEWSYFSTDFTSPPIENYVQLTFDDDYWGIKESTIMNICDSYTKLSPDKINIKKNGNRIGFIQIDLCKANDINEDFVAILFVNNKIGITDIFGWLYYENSNEVMVSMMVAPPKFNLNRPIESGVEPVLAVHGVGGYYPYWGDNFFSEVDSENNYDMWQFYYPFDQEIGKSGDLLGEALNYLLGNELFDLPLSYQKNDLKIVSHSMGGLVSRSYIQSTQYQNNIQKLIMLGTPNHGSYAAFRLTHDFTGAIGGWFTGKDRFAPAYKEMIPGSKFLKTLNSKNPSKLNNDNGYAYVTVAGVGARSSKNRWHQEIKDQDDEAVAVASASLLEYEIPLLISDHFHSKDDDPENIDGLTNSAGIVLPLLESDYISISNHPKYIGSMGFNELSDFIDSDIPDKLGIAIININFSDQDYSLLNPRAVHNDNETRIFSANSNPTLAIGADKIKGDIFNSSSESFIVNTRAYLDDIGLSFEEKNQSVVVGRYTGRLLQPWIRFGDPANLNFRPLQTNYSDMIELTSAQKLLMIVPIIPQVVKRNKLSQSIQYIDSRVDTALIYLELPGNYISIPDYKIKLFSPSGTEYKVNNTPANWEVIEDKEQGFAYFYIPNPEKGNWEIGYNKAIDDAYVALSVKSDLKINSYTKRETHTVGEPIKVHFEVENGDYLDNYSIETEYSCYNNKQEAIETGILVLQNVDAYKYETQFVAAVGSVYCTIDSDLKAGEGEGVLYRTSFTSVDLNASNTTSTEGDEKTYDIPKESKLFQNYPNPFNPSTNISYSLDQSQKVTLEVYNVLGQRVAHLVNDFKSAGYHELSFNASNLSSGVYYYRLQAGDYVKTEKMMLIK